MKDGMANADTRQEQGAVEFTVKLPTRWRERMRRAALADGWRDPFAWATHAVKLEIGAMEETNGYAEMYG